MAKVFEGNQKLALINDIQQNVKRNLPVVILRREIAFKGNIFSF